MVAQPSIETISKAADVTNNLVNEYIVSPVVGLGIAGLRFDIIEEERLEDNADITDSFLEDNSAVQDHIAKKPIIITLRGFVGELINEEEEPKTKIQEITEKLVMVNSYLPVLSGAAQQLNGLLTGQKDSTAETIKEATDTSVDLYQAYQQLNPPESRQAAAYNFFRALYNANQLLSVETPFNFFSDMMIQNVVATQGNNKFIADFSITLKQIRTVQTKFVTFDSTQYQGRLQNQAAETQNQGNVKGIKQNVSLLKSISGSLGGLIN